LYDCNIGGLGEIPMKRYSLAILSFFVLLCTASSQAAIFEGLVLPFLRHLTLPRVIQGGVNNGLLGVFYYQFFYKTQQRMKSDVEQFVKNTKPWTEAPTVLQPFNPRIFAAGDNPTKSRLSYSLLPEKPFYVIDGSAYISHKLKFAHGKGNYSDYELYQAIKMEYDRQHTLSAKQSDSTQSFFEGIGKVILVKKVGSKIIYPTLRPFFEQEGLHFFWTYPRLAFWSVADLCTKFFSGRYTWKNDSRQKYIESCNEISNHWKEMEARDAKKGDSD